MNKNIGLWIDHREAIIVVPTGEDEQIIRIKSGAERQTRLAGGSRKDGLQHTENLRGKKFTGQLNRYYDEIIAQIRHAALIQIFGPGEAKGELSKRLDDEGLKQHIVEIEAVDNMTDNQIVSKVRERFSKSNMSAK